LAAVRPESGGSWRGLPHNSLWNELLLVRPRAKRDHEARSSRAGRSAHSSAPARIVKWFTTRPGASWCASRFVKRFTTCPGG